MRNKFFVLAPVAALLLILAVVVSTALAWNGGVHKNVTCEGVTITANPENPYGDWVLDHVDGTGFFAWDGQTHLSGTVTAVWVKHHKHSPDEYHSENYRWSADKPEGCEPPPVYGCTDPDAANYNPQATVDDESCEYRTPPPPPVLTETPPAPRPPYDVCEVFNDAFAVPDALPFGVVGWSVAGNANFDQYNPTKRGLVFQPGVLIDGRQVFVTDAGGTDHIYTVVLVPDQPPSCVETAAPTVSEPANLCMANADFGVFRGTDAVYFAFSCDPNVQILVDGVLAFDDANFGYPGGERVRVPADPGATIEIWVDGSLWGSFAANSTEFLPAG